MVRAMRYWLRQYGAVARNSLTVALGSPFILILHLALLVFQGGLACLPFFTFGEQVRLIRDQSLALCLLGGCLSCSLAANALLTEDIRRGTAAIMMSRPLGSLVYVAGKWTGLMAGILVPQLSAGAACLWLTKIAAFPILLDLTGLGVYAAAVALPLVVVAVHHYRRGGRYVLRANLALLVSVVVLFAAYVVVCANGTAWFGPITHVHDTEDSACLLEVAFSSRVDWPTLAAIVLVWLALVVYSGLVTILAVLFDSGLLLGFSLIVFGFGLLSEYFLHTIAGVGWGATLGRALLPNWQIFWVSDRLAEQATVPPGYIAGCAVHALLYAVVCILIATVLFQRRELEGWG